MKAYGLTNKGSRKLIRDGSGDLLISPSKRSLRTEHMQPGERMVKLEIRIVGTAR